MQGKDTLLQLIQENNQYIHDILGRATPEMLWWQADDEANSIGVLIWHGARVLDVFLHQNVHGLRADDELWFKDGYHEKTGYDPRGIGSQGWGMLSGYERNEVEAIPQMSVEMLRGYYNTVIEAVEDYLEATDQAILAEAAQGFGGKQPNWFWVRHPLFDLTRHVGEMLALRGMWQRQHEKGGE